MIDEYLDRNSPTTQQFHELLQPYKTEFGAILLRDYHELLKKYEIAEMLSEDFKICTSYLLHYAWEKLHTGHWKNVHICWRVLYASIKLLTVLYSLRKSINEDEGECNSYNYCHIQYTQLICELDYSLIMGYSIFDSFASKLASELHKCIKLTSEESVCSEDITFQLDNDNFEMEMLNQTMINMNKLARVSCPSLEMFKKLMKLGRPFIITNAINFWPAYHQHNWTLKYWKDNFGHRLVPVEIGSKYTEENWGQKLMTINDFINNYFFTSNNEKQTNLMKGYLAQYEIFSQIPELESDIHIPDYCTLTGDAFDEDTNTANTNVDDIHIDTNIWFGPKGTVSPLHHDNDRANLLSQVKGYKYVVLYEASQTLYLYAYEDNMLSNTSKVDIEKPDLNKYPEFVKASGFYGILGPGEMLYIPPRCWHYVRSLSASFSVNFWWDVVPSLIPPWQ
ncbi:unnamed protein product [Trichobilharzia regenti]|uniref:JmjC domain-containing protein n=1 Tax=Trichobilharzia regenti TaxID=157069 RepID=A0A183WNF3_TRIRE|nr:unnamed protein product [Trichobilharzia regenti]VDQ09536.1 unnamed protein product [Trichobilharzia regenti]